MHLRVLYVIIILAFFATPAFGMEPVTNNPTPERIALVKNDITRKATIQYLSQKRTASHQETRARIEQFINANRDRFEQFSNQGNDSVETVEYIPLHQFEWFGQLPLGDSFNDISIDVFGEFFADDTIQFTTFQMMATQSVLDNLRINFGIEQQVDAPKAHLLSSGIEYDIQKLTLYGTTGYRTDEHNNIQAGFSYGF